MGTIRVPAGVEPIHDKRLDLIRAIKSLEKEKLPALIDAVKATMRDKSATFAESDFTVAELRNAGGAGKDPQPWIDPVRLYDLVRKRKISLDQFLAAVIVSDVAAANILTGAQREAVTVQPRSSGRARKKKAKALCVDFKPGSGIDLEAALGALQSALRQIHG
jgi:hypothetical protein